jgi:hypothetical protein
VFGAAKLSSVILVPEEATSLLKIGQVQTRVEAIDIVAMRDPPPILSYNPPFSGLALFFSD